AMFGNVENLPLQNVYTMPDIVGGISLRTGRGHYVGAINESIEGTKITNADHDVVATVDNNIMGGSQVNLSNGETISGIENIYGGENFYRLGESVGYTKPNIEGGIDVFPTTGEQILSTSSSDQFSTTIITIHPSTEIIGNAWQENYDFVEGVEIDDLD